jgi:hypothetical protein
MIPGNSRMGKETEMLKKSRDKLGVNNHVIKMPIGVFWYLINSEVDVWKGQLI